MENATSMKNEQEEKLTLIDSFITAMFLPKEYSKLLKLSNGKIVCYIVVLTLLLGVIQYAIPTLGAIAGMGGVKNIILYEIPKFSFENGEFFLEEKIERNDEVAGIYTLIDTSVDKFTKEDVPANMMEAVMVSKSGILIYNAMYGFTGVVDELSFDLLPDVTLTNEIVADYSFIIYGVLCSGLIAMCLMIAFQHLCMTLFYATFMYVLMRNVLPDLSYGTSFKVTLFAQTIGAIVEAVTYCLGIEVLIMAGSIFNVFVTVALMNRAVMKLGLEQEF